jgi:FkbM family methyltransferase
MTQSADRIIRTITNNQRLVEIARRLHISGPLKAWEYRLRGPRDGLIRHVVAGVTVALAARDAIDFRVFDVCYANEMDFIEALAAKLTAGDIFYDIGTNAGQFLIPMAKIVAERGRVFGFEPHPENYQRAVTNITLNHLTNVQVFRVAFAERAGELQMYGVRANATVVPRAAAYNQSQPTTLVPSVRGDDFCLSADLPIPMAVKIDVEGAEFAVLSGLEKTLSHPACELLCLEIHPCMIPAEVSTEMVLSLVRSLGYTRLEALPRGTEIHVLATKEPF